MVHRVSAVQQRLEARRNMYMKIDANSTYEITRPATTSSSGKDYFSLHTGAKECIILG